MLTRVLSTPMARCTAVVAFLVALALPASVLAAPMHPKPPTRPKGKIVKRNTAKPLSAHIASGRDTGILTISGGTGPFSVSMLTDSGLRPIYAGSTRMLAVPLVAGVNNYQIAGGPEATVTSALGTTQFWVADLASRMLRRYDAALDTVTVSVHCPGDDASASVVMRNISVRPSDDHVFAVFSDNTGTQTRNRLIELAPDGSSVATINVAGAYKIQDVTFDSSDNIYVSDRGTGAGVNNRIRIIKLSPSGTVLDSTQTVLPPSVVGYPMVNLPTMIEYQAAANRLVVRINTATFAILDPATLAVESYRFGGDTCHTCMTLNSNNASDVVLYTGGSGFNLPAFFGKQSMFLSDPKYLDSNIYRTPSHDWEVTPTLSAIADVAVDSNDYVYTIQNDGAAGITRAYVVDPAGAPVKTIDLPDGMKISVVR